MDLASLLSQAPPHPRRVVCLTEETTETLYRIGAGDLVVGVSGFTVRPREARRKPRISSFLSADAEAILALRPDLVVGFSDLQADVAADLVRRGVPVLVTNQRSVAEILQTVRL
ncbi:MAG TPA: helical backbone metal receptor, partial [Anaeromyxobacter sp.]